jgi:lambda family phage portal protein
LHFNELTQLAERSEIETGESIFLVRAVKNRFLPFALQAIEPDRLATYQGRSVTGNTGYCDGIEYDTATGETVAYHFLDDGYTAKTIRVPASDVIFGYSVLRPGQMRGISPFVTAVLAADDLSQFIDATLDTAKLASKYLAFVKSEDITAWQGARVTETDSENKKIEEIENAIIEYLKPGEDVTFASHNIPNNQFDPFTKFVLRMVAIATGTSFELLSGDYSGLSYSNLKAIRADLVRGIKPRFDRRVKHFCTPVYRLFLQQAVLTGRIVVPGFTVNEYFFEKCQWIWPGMESPDPLRDGKAAINLISQGLMSPQEFTAARGRDYEEVLSEIAESKKMMEEKGIDLKPVSTANANSPAAVDGDTGDGLEKAMTKYLQVIKRAAADDSDIITRSMPVSPATLDAEKRSVDVVMTTENPVKVYAYEYGLVDEVILMSGAKFPKRIPLLDTHDRYSSKSVLGSVSDIRVEQNKAGVGQMIGQVVFSATADDVMIKVSEGHLTDFSVGYTPTKSTFIPANERKKISGREFAGPILITEKWELKELSVCPIGADKAAKARAYNNTTNKQSEVDEMDKKTRDMLEARGLPKSATEDEAWAYLDKITRADVTPAPVVPAPAPVQPAAVDTDKIRAEAANAERGRVSEIMEMGRKFDLAEEARAAVNDGTKVDAFMKTVLAEQEKRAAAQPMPSYRFEVGLDDREKFRAAAIDGLSIRCGLTVATPAAGHDELRGYSLREMAREVLIRAGIRPPSNIMDMVGRALTTDDFANIMANVANKSLMEGYDTAAETWATWCGVGSVPDFKLNTMVRASEASDLDEVPEDTEYQYGTQSDAKETFQIVTYGKIFALSRQAVINDDLGALNDQPRKHGEAAARKVGDLPYAVLVANAAMGDSIALFHASHANIMDNAAVSVDALNDAIALMKLQKDIGGLRRLNIRPLFYLGPVGTEGTTEQFFNTGSIGGVTNSPNLINPYSGSRFTRIYEPRLDDDDVTKWYLMGPKGKTVTVFFLNGQQTPYLETRQGFTIDGVEWKVRIDAVAKAVDWKAMVLVDAAEES